MKTMKLFALVVLLFSTIACASKEELTTSIYRFDGIEPAVYYAAPKPLTEGDDGEIAVIMIQGWHGGVQVLQEQLAMQKALGGIYIVSPMYPRTEMMEHFGIEKDGRAIWNESWPLDLTVPGVPDDDWRGGGDANGTQLSSFEIIDALLAKLSDREHFPNLKRIVLAGFSAGGQFVGRYVAVGKGEVGPGIELRYAAMAPSTYLIPNPDDIWHYGLKGRPRYSSEVSEEQIMENLRSRRCLHACGALDTLEANLDRTATAMKQGVNRYVRFMNFRDMVGRDERWNSVTQFYVFDGFGHSAKSAYAHPFFVEYVIGE